MPIRNGIIEAIGNTPLIKLKRASEETGCTILGKAEFMNPGQSVKDRAALFIIRDALNSGQLQPGGTVVEGTAGNTGIGLALVGNALGLQDGHRHPRDAVRREEGHAAACRRRADRGAGRALQGSQQLREIFRPSRRAACRDRAERRDLGQSVRQCRQPPGPYRDHGAGDLEGDRRQGRRLHLRGRHRRHAGRRLDGAEGAQPRHRHRPCRSDGRRALQLLQAR